MHPPCRVLLSLGGDAPLHGNPTAHHTIRSGAVTTRTTWPTGSAVAGTMTAAAAAAVLRVGTGMAACASPACRGTAALGLLPAHALALTADDAAQAVATAGAGASHRCAASAHGALMARQACAPGSSLPASGAGRVAWAAPALTSGAGGLGGSTHIGGEATARMLHAGMHAEPLATLHDKLYMHMQLAQGAGGRGGCLPACAVPGLAPSLRPLHASRTTTQQTHAFSRPMRTKAPPHAQAPAVRAAAAWALTSPRQIITTCPLATTCYPKRRRHLPLAACIIYVWHAH